MRDKLRRTFRFYKHETRKLLTKLYYKVILRRPNISMSGNCFYAPDKEKEGYLKAFKI